MSHNARSLLSPKAVPRLFFVLATASTNRCKAWFPGSPNSEKPEVLASEDPSTTTRNQEVASLVRTGAIKLWREERTLSHFF